MGKYAISGVNYAEQFYSIGHWYEVPASMMEVVANQNFDRGASTTKG
jgi:hypothetical protein